MKEPKVLKIPREGIWIKNSDLATPRNTIILRQLYLKENKTHRSWGGEWDDVSPLCGGKNAPAM